MKRNWLRGIIGGLSFSSALFIFQACYGMPQDFTEDLLVEGIVTAKSSGRPIKNIHVFTDPFGSEAATDDKGAFSFYTLRFESVKLTFEDIDSTDNGSFATRDTVIVPREDPAFVDRVYMEIALEEQ
ncbi:MAG: hypothetical protein V2B15_09350 [Bacteroidota bacterium]